MNKKIKVTLVLILAIIAIIIVSTLCTYLPESIEYPASFLLGMPIGSIATTIIIDILR